MVRPSMAERRPLSFRATCGVTLLSRSSATKSSVSKALSVPTVTRWARPAWGSIRCRAAKPPGTSSRGSAWPEARVATAPTIRPWRFSISAWPMKQSLASLPRPLRYSRASGSVVEAWVSLRRFWPRKSCSAVAARIGRRAGEVDPDFGPVADWSRVGSVVVDGDDDEEAETEDRCGAEGEDRPGGVAGAGDGDGPRCVTRFIRTRSMPGRSRLLDNAARAFDPGVGIDADEVREREIEKLPRRSGN